MDCVAHQPTRSKVTDKGNKVALGRVERFKAGGVSLAAFSVRIHTDGFDRNGGNDVYFQFVLLLRIDQSPHVVGLEPGWFFIDEGHEAYRARRMQVFQKPRKFQQGSEAA